MEAENKMIMVEAAGARKGAGDIRFEPREGWIGDVAELPENIALPLLKSEGMKEPKNQLFRLAQKTGVPPAKCTYQKRTKKR